MSEPPSKVEGAVEPSSKVEGVVEPPSKVEGVAEPSSKPAEASDPPNKVEEAAAKAIETVIEPAVQDTPSVAPSADKPGISAVVGAAQAVQAALHAQQGTVPTYEPLPAYALQYAPLMWLHNEEQYWPGNPLEHLENCIPQHKTGTLIDVPKDIFGKWPSLKLPSVNDPDVYLCLNQEDPRVNARIEKLMASHGKPDPVTRRSDSTCWLILVDKSTIVEPGVVDVFYFYFYPYNLGNTVAFTKFGNHVGDWEHSMVRFKDGKPIALHLSAHADGHSFPWSIVEKMGDRPVGYVAKGSHAMYAKPGSKHYSPVPVVGPVDYTNKGILWDPSLNYVAAKFDVPTATFTPLTAPPPTATTTAAPPTPGEAPAAASHPGAGSASPASSPVYDTKLTPEEIVTILDYKGRWGNSFSDVREPKGSVGDKVSELGDKLHSVFHFGKKHDAEPKKERRLSLGLSQRLSMLRWAEGPTGPRYKSLERVGVTWNTTELSNELV